MYALRLFVLAALALLCSAFTTGAAQPCIADYGNARGGFQLCSPVSVSWVKELARNCTGGDLSRAYTALAKLCDDTRKENAGLEHAIMDRNLDNVPTDHDSRIIVRWPSSDAATSAAESKVQSRQWQSSSSSSKRYSWLWKDLGVDGFFLGSIFAERSVRFALSGLLLTTLTSFIFL